MVTPTLMKVKSTFSKSPRRLAPVVFGVSLLAATAVASCSSGGGSSVVATIPDASVDAGPAVEAADAGEEASASAIHASDVPLDGLSDDEIRLFRKGDAVFELVFREPDGLGPLYIRSSCGACHEAGSRGPGLVQKLAVVEADGVTAAADQSLLAWGHTVRQGLAAGATTPIVAPADPRVKVSTRLGPPVLGRGYMEAIADAEIERVAAEQAVRSDAIHGKINRVTFASVPNPDATFGTHATGESNLIGRFGLKARVVSLDDFTADAFQGDMGITTPMRPTELANPDGLTDDAHPGVDLGIEEVNLVASYLRRIAIPVRVGLSADARALFDRAQCSVCHVPSLKTRADYPIKQLAGIDAPVYTDMLLHDMGDALADGMTDGSSTSRLWRTAPLIGMRFAKAYLHDGRATSVEAAIRAHDGEAKGAADAFGALTESERDELLRFVGAL